MKNRNLNHKDDWATPLKFFEGLNKEFKFDFDPCPFQNNIEEFDGLNCEWGSSSYCNPPYSRKLKELFVKKAIKESKKGKTVVMLLPVSTSTVLFHEHILPNAKDIRFIKRRLKFSGINSKGEYVNWQRTLPTPPEGATIVKNSGMHDSMIVIF